MKSQMLMTVTSHKDRLGVAIFPAAEPQFYLLGFATRVEEKLILGVKG